MKLPARAPEERRDRRRIGGRIYLSPPHVGRTERLLLKDAFESNWIAPLGPHVDAFEAEFGAVMGGRPCLAVNSGTSALHLALQACGVSAGDEVLVSTLTFIASVAPVCYLGARPVFIDSEPCSWNMDPALLSDVLTTRARQGRLPKAVMVVHLYGQSADLDPILEICNRFEVPLIEDAAEALGATYKGRPVGTFGRAAVFSFNGNKIITASSGGMLVAEDAALIDYARKLATQARDDAPYYEHSQVGYNYRLSNLLAAIGRGQLQRLDQRVNARRRNFDRYADLLGDLSGLMLAPEAPWARHTRWLTTITIDPAEFGADREEIRLALETVNIEARHIWKPMHLQPVFRKEESVGGRVAEHLFEYGLCLPSGSNLHAGDLDRVAATVRRCAKAGAGARHPGR